MVLKNKLGYDGLFVVPRRGHSGGLALLWGHNVNVRVISSSEHHIDYEVKLDNDCPYRLTKFYGYANQAQRYRSWALLRSLAYQSSLPWIILGDFNGLIGSYEKRGRNGHPPD